MKKTLYLLPFILYLIFFALIIALGGGLESFVVPDFYLLLALLLICGLGAISKKKVFNLIGGIALFTVSFALVKMGIENNYLALAEVKIAASLLIYYLIAFIISKDKLLITMTGVIIGILLILFVPIKFQYRDGGTTEYRAIAYRFFKWNRLMDGGNHYNAEDLHWFPHNFHSFEYYTPVHSPKVTVSTNNQEIMCSKGMFHWTKTVDGESIMTIADVFASAVHWDYNDMLTIIDDNIVKINTSYSISNVKYAEYKEEYANSDIDTVNPEFIEINFNNENKSIDLTNLEAGTYIITFTIHNDKDYADYGFKVEIIR